MTLTAFKFLHSCPLENAEDLSCCSHSQAGRASDHCGVRSCAEQLFPERQRRQTPAVDPGDLFSLFTHHNMRLAIA